MDTKEISGSYIQREIDFLKAAMDEIADMPCIDYPQYTEEEVNAIIAKEKDKVEKTTMLLFATFITKTPIIPKPNNGII